ncbi:MchS3 family protein [Burkholderia sp. Bp9090]|uniref:MchS3 family protein n=1 Tax=Burkholderia sp. Bp9090 TaxID=2184567 RepID=UPI000F5EC772|nr:MchS3 family protein [Burkholderia sp. Bp9090]
MKFIANNLHRSGWQFRLTGKIKNKIIGILMVIQMSIPVSVNSMEIPKEEFRDINVFSLGLVGFVGHISPQEKMYRKIKQTAGAKSYFVKILESKDATLESKMYAMCGLREIDHRSFIKYKNTFSSSLKVSIMKGDILSRESISDVLYRINKFGCN